MKSAIILQPGRIGDIVIILPIAHLLHEAGFTVRWPILHDILPHFEGRVSFPIQFIPLRTFDFRECSSHVRPDDKVIDLFFGFEGRESKTLEWRRSGETFDAYKYQLAGLDPNLKYLLPRCILRDVSKERDLFEHLHCGDSPYCLVHDQGSSSRIDVDRWLPHGQRVLRIKPLTGSVLDWLLVLEKASSFRMIDSVFSNLANQMMFPVPGIRFHRPMYPGDFNYPELLPHWETVRETCGGRR